MPGPKEIKTVSTGSSQGETISVQLVGTGGGGKTTVAEKIVTGNFNANPKLTTGPEFHVLNVTEESHGIVPNPKGTKVQWIINPGQDRFAFMVDEYIKTLGGKNAIFVVVVDPTQKRSIVDAAELIKRIKAVKVSAKMLLYCNKADLIVAHPPAPEFWQQLSALATEHGISSMVDSAKTSDLKDLVRRVVSLSRGE